MGIFDKIFGRNKDSEEDFSFDQPPSLPQFPASSTSEPPATPQNDLSLNRPSQQGQIPPIFPSADQQPTAPPPVIPEPSFVRPPPVQIKQPEAPSPASGDKLEMISLKLDNIKSTLESINHRLTIIEQQRRY